MKRSGYVDSQGNPVNQSFESKKSLLNIFLVFNVLVPLILIAFIIYTSVINNKCNKIYNNIESAAKEYFEDNNLLPTIEGENETLSIKKLYNEDYLSLLSTDNLTCGGSIKVTRYKKEYIYTLDVNSCDVCSVSSRYKGWSSEVGYKPKAAIVDVIPYYNYYERQVNVTKWSSYIEPEKLQEKNSKYGFQLPIDENMLPEIPEEGNVVEIEKQDKVQFRYFDKLWKWYDIVGDYSSYSSEQPAGFTMKDERSEINSKWSKYSLDHPEEKPYRSIQSTTGYIFYYEKDGEKIYANHKQYTASEDVDRNKYNKREEQTATMYKYRDKKWRWYNGQKRKYSGYSSSQPKGYSYRDEDTVIQNNYSSWSDSSSLNDSNSWYRSEERRVVTRFRYLYEILSDSIYESPVSKEKFTKDVGMSVVEFVDMDDYKIEVSYKFKYRKR